MNELLVIAGAGFVSVFALGFQSRNVNHGNYAWAAITSLFVGFTSAYLWRHITAPNAGLMGSAVYGLSGALAITASMYVHNRWVKKHEERTPAFPQSAEGHSIPSEV